MKRRMFLTAAAASLVQTLLEAQRAMSGPAPAAPGPSMNRFPGVTLITHDGRSVDFYQDLVKGKLVLINFMYATCTNSCPTYTANLARVQRLFGDRMGRDVFMYSITLDPDHDTPAVLQNYMKAYGVQPGWTFLTGAKPDIELLRRKLGLRDLNPVVDADKTQHIGVVLYGNERFDRWAACPALSEPAEIVRYVDWLVGGVGSATA